MGISSRAALGQADSVATGPFTHEVAQELHLANPHDQALAFKVRTVQCAFAPRTNPPAGQDHRAQTVRPSAAQPAGAAITNPRASRYCVRPNSGTIAPRSAVSIQVLLQAMKEDPPMDAKCRDKFLVQSALVPGEGSNVAAIVRPLSPSPSTHMPADAPASGPRSRRPPRSRSRSARSA